MKEILEKVIEIARDSGKYMVEAKDLKIEMKSDIANIVTNIDVEVQRRIIESLKNVIDDASFIAEEKENEDVEDGFAWVIDPIDGTTNFAYDYKHSCVSIGLLKDKRAILGVVYNPYLDELFTAVENEGSYLNGIRLQVSENDLSRSLVAIGTSPYKKQLASVSFSILEDIFTNTRDIRRSGSAALDICYVACGRVDAYFEANVSPWDYCAASVILSEAGGLYRSLTSEEFTFNKPIGMLAGNKYNFTQLLEIVRKYKI